MDSERLVLEDPRLKAVNPDSIAAIAMQGYWGSLADLGLYRPLVTFSYLINYAVLGNGSQSFGYHAVNFLLHALNVFLVWMLAGKTLRGDVAAFFVAAVFAVHPITTEAVTNISGRPDLMAAAFALGGLLVHASGVQGRSPLLLCVLALGGMWSKESSVVLIPLMLLYDLSFRDALRNGAWRGAMPGYLGALGGTVAAVGWRAWVLRQGRAAEFPFLDNPIIGSDWLAGRLTALGVVLKDLQLLAWPSTLSADYSYAQIVILPLGMGLAALALVALVFCAVAYAWKIRPVFFFGLLFFLALFPTSNILIEIGSILGERFLYLPLVGFSGAVVGLLFSKAHSRIAIAGMMLIVVVLGMRTFGRNRDFKDDITLATATMEAAPKSFRAYHVAAGRMGRTGDVSLLPRAIAYEEKAVAILSGLPREQRFSGPYSFLGLLLELYGATQGPPGTPAADQAYGRALAAFEEGANVDRLSAGIRRQRDLARGWRLENIPDEGDAALFFHYGVVLKRLGRLEEALKQERVALGIAPGEPGLYAEQAEILAGLGRNAEAVASLAQAYLLDSAPARLTRLEEAYQRQHPDAACAIAKHVVADELNLACSTAKALVCGAEAGLLRNLRDAHRANLADLYRERRITREACP